MQDHMKNKHDIEKHSKCPHCDYHAPNNSKIHVHIDGHHAELYEKQFDCNHCARCFIWETSLKSHLTKHRIRKQLACKYCGAKVSTFPELDNHVIEVHQMPINTLAGKTVPLDVDLDLQIPNDVKQKAKSISKRHSVIKRVGRRLVFVICVFIQNFLPNSYFILQIYHVKSFKMMHVLSLYFNFSIRYS